MLNTTAFLPQITAEKARATGQQVAGQTEAKVRAAAEDFEAVFLTEMLRPAFEQLSTDGLTGGGQGEKIYRSLMVQEYGKAIANTGGIGLADSVYRDILKLQEA